jgi:hypothetical protein
MKREEGERTFALEALRRGDSPNKVPTEITVGRRGKIFEFKLVRLCPDVSTPLIDEFEQLCGIHGSTDHRSQRFRQILVVLGAENEDPQKDRNT